MNKRHIIFLIIFQLSTVLYSEDIKIIKIDDFIGQGISSKYYLQRNKTNNIFSLYNFNSNDSFPINFNYDGPISKTYIPITNDFFYLIIGGTSAKDPKNIIEFNAETLEINWSYKFPGDFATNLYLHNDHLYTTMRNNGAVFDFNIIENSVQYVKCYESAIYHVYKINNNEIFTNGANDYKNENYAIKILDNNLNITKEYKGYSESYKFKHNNKDQFLIFSDNQYLDPDKNIHLFNYKMEEQASINIKDYIADVSYSFDGNFILIGHGYGVSSVVSIYSLEGEYIKSISIETNDIYERIDMVLGSQNEIIVVLGKSER